MDYWADKMKKKSNVENKVAIIAGTEYILPSDARYFGQDPRGMWFSFTRKPRPVDGDWPAKNKLAVVKRNRAVKTTMIHSDIAATLSQVFIR